MFGWLNSFSSADGFLPHGHCYLWSTGLIWTMATTDMLIGLAYVSISLSLYFLIRKIKMPFHALFLAFGLFIFACGATHFMEVYTLWIPAYWVAAALKAITALASIATAIALFPLRKKVLAFVELANLSHQRKIQVEEAYAQLELRVQERTLELKSSNEELSRKEDFLNRLMDNNHDCVKVLASDSKIIYMNSGGFKALGITDPSEVIGKLWLSVWSGEHQVNAKKAFAAAAAGEMGQFQGHTYSKGQSKWWDVTVSPIKNSVQSEPEFLCVSRDITAQRESEAKFEQLANSMPQIVWMARPDGYVDYYNDRWFEYTGFGAGREGDNSWKPILHPDDLDAGINGWASSVKSGEPYEIELRLKNSATGEFRWFLCRGVPVRDESGKIIRWFGTDTDIHQYKQLNEKLQHALDARDEFLSVASHELRTPVTSLMLQAQLVQRLIHRNESEAFAKAQVEKLAMQTDRQASVLSRLVEDMFEIGRIKSGKMTISPEPFELVELLKSVIERMGPQFKNAGLDAPTLHASGPVHGTWDKIRIEQVFSNILTNAIKYGNKLPIEVRVLSDGKTVTISFRDNGIGIAKQDLDRIFNRFERAVSASDVSGLGLGLFISQQIAIAHGGKIWAESELGNGSTFFVQLLVSSTPSDFSVID